MPPDNSLGRFVGELISLPFVLLRELFRLLAWLLRLSSRWRSVPVQLKARTRAVCGAFGVVACLVLAAHGFPVVGPELTAGIAGLSLLYLVVGILQTVRAERLTFDLMAVFWRCALVIGAAALFVCAKLGGL